MRVRSLHVKNYRSICDEELTLNSLTALVGRNGSGKSSFLNALDLFYNPNTQLTEADFYSENTDDPIEITVTFDSLSDDEIRNFAKYIENDELAVVGVFILDEEKKKTYTYHGNRLQHPPFGKIREQTDKRSLTKEYNELIEDSIYSTLSNARGVDSAKEQMEKWEQEHPESCERGRDDGQFFGWTNVGQGYLRRCTQLIRVPAVRDASDEATEGRGSAISELMNLVVRKVLADHPAIADLRERAAREFSEIMEQNARPQLDTLQSDLSQILGSFVPDASVVLAWRQLPELEIGDPQSDVRLHEDGYPATVTRTGHGLQRAFIFALLQHLSEVKRTDEQNETGAHTEEKDTLRAKNTSTAPDLVLSIEEPELYQHPSRQRHLAEVLLQLTEENNPGAAASTQVIYTTHSPLFVGLDRFDDVRVLRKQETVQGEAKSTTVESTTMEAVAQSLRDATAASNEFSADTLRPRLQAVMTPVVNEGFFADVVVLVEGEGDRAAIQGAARAMNVNLDAQGIAVIPCSGKENLDRPLIIFRNLGIPIYVVWDGDKGKSGSTPYSNLRLLRILGREEVDWPQHMDSTSTCFETNLDDVLERETDPAIFEQCLLEAQDKFGLSGEAARKNSLVIQRIVECSISEHEGSDTLRSIVRHVLELKENMALRV
ncbi:MAG: ATP-dependent endonuclease [bacterium]|nr:ATP-dependent endonuclease [bacterium]